MSGMKIMDLASRSVESIKEEWEKQDDPSTWDLERCIHETVDSIIPHANWEIIEFLADDTDLGWESDIHTLENQDNIFTFLRGRIFEEVERHVLCETHWMSSDWDDKPNNSPDNLMDDGWALASAGMGTDEDYSSGEVL
jgi:hypothetical protein